MKIDLNHLETAVLAYEAANQENAVIRGYSDGELLGEVSSDYLYTGLEYFQDRGLDMLTIGSSVYMPNA